MIVKSYLNIHILIFYVLRGILLKTQKQIIKRIYHAEKTSYCTLNTLG